MYCSKLQQLYNNVHIVILWDWHLFTFHFKALDNTDLTSLTFIFQRYDALVRHQSATGNHVDNRSIIQRKLCLFTHNGEKEFFLLGVLKDFFKEWFVFLACEVEADKNYLKTLY